MNPAPGPGERPDERPGSGGPRDEQPGSGDPLDERTGSGASRDRDERRDGGDRRDRDTTGRPRNARPRDGLGRPLPRSSATGEDRVPDDLEIGPAEAVALGRSLLEQGRPFHAHEVFEAVWKTGDPGERELWQGLAQIAVGITHARRGNSRGAVSLLRRGARRVSDYAAAAPDSLRYGIDLPAAAARAEETAAVIERDGLPAVPEESLRSPF